MKVFTKITGALQTLHILAIPFLLVFLLLPAGCRPIVSLGKNPSGAAQKKIDALPNYHDGQFHNLYPPPPRDTFIAQPTRLKWTRLLKYFFSKPQGTQPREILPSVQTDLKNTTYERPTVVWFGHSSFLIKTTTANILVDPTFSGYAGPFRNMITAFEGSNVYRVKDMPRIDVVIISHDHYDHMDYETIKLLRKKVKKIVVPVGVGSHLRRWGFEPDQITELNWHESIALNKDLRITATPAHHRSNRSFAARKTLWASYAIEAGGYKIYFSGDSGYSQHFMDIGNRYGPFDLALMECGQYNEKWPQSHMFPSQSAKAAVDIKAKMMIPMHWGKFAESEHPWNEPIKLLLISADSLKLPVSVPLIGQPYTIGDAPSLLKWWEF